METELFTNRIEIEVTSNKVFNLLANLKNILQWDREVIQVDELQNNEFMIMRGHGAVNNKELVTVEISNQQVIYKSTTGKIAYTIVWSMRDVGTSRTQLSQTLQLNETNAWVPLAKLISPMMKSAFLQNLRVIKAVSEFEHV